MDCPYCKLKLEEEELDNGQVVLACPNCNYSEDTPYLKPPENESIERWRVKNERKS